MHFALSTRQCSRHQVITNLRTSHQLRGRALKPPQLATYLSFRTLTAEFVRDGSFLRPISSLVTCSRSALTRSSPAPAVCSLRPVLTSSRCVTSSTVCSSVAHQIRLECVQSSPMHAASMTALTSFTSTVSIASSNRSCCFLQTSDKLVGEIGRTANGLAHRPVIIGLHRVPWLN
jgi:hypothetical protein